MDGILGTSGWLERARSRIENSQVETEGRQLEWEDFSKRLSDAVQQQLVESHVNTFWDLSEAEKSFVLQKATRAIQGGDSYRALVSVVSNCLEEHVYCHIVWGTQDGDRQLKNKSAVLLRHLQDAVITLLEKRPELKGRLRSFLNRSLPGDLRRLTWKLYLSDPKARLGYLSQLAANRATSIKDREISLRCQALLDAEPTFQNLKNNRVAARCLRNVLSYYHKLQGKPTPLRDQDYFLPVPLLQVILDGASLGISVDSVSALLVEEFITLMKLQPHFDPNGASIMEEVASLLEQADRDLARFLECIDAQPEEDSRVDLLRSLRHLLKPVISTLFVGYLSMDTLLYLWDQIILGIGQPSYNCLPAFAAVFVLLLRGQLLKCQSLAEVEATPKRLGPSLPIQAFQDLIGKHFYEELYSQLHGGNEDYFPAHDPTQIFPAWSYRDYQTAAPQRMKPEDRRQTREERELLQRQHVERIQQEERLQKFREEEQQRQQEIRMLRLFEETKRKFESQKVDLEEQLLRERQAHYELQRKAQEQISGLQAEINRLVEQKMPSSSANSAGSFQAPPPSPLSQTPSQTSQSHFLSSETVVAVGKHETRDKKNTARTITLELLKQMMEAARTMVNGSSPEEQECLDTATTEHLRAYDQDCKNAKIDMFGYEISEEEIEDLSEPRRKNVRKKLEEAVRRGAEARYKAARRGHLPGPITHMGML